MYKNILVATDGTRLSGKAIAHAVALAKALGAGLTAFYASPDYPLPVYAEGAVVEPMSRREYAALCKDEADRILGAVASKAKSARIEFNAVHTINSTPWRAILAAARKHGCDVIVMASHGRRGVSAMLLGSETQKVLTHSKIPVIVVR
ncbi:MAG TPA: universal stress protein [Casimicrobiaceae bacterium]|jgi:nucleotide-binding universal stress UspA family protein|nr:universal stress protein [Casimicrobiaceae bacterium]